MEGNPFEVIPKDKENTFPENLDLRRKVSEMKPKSKEDLQMAQMKRLQPDFKEELDGPEEDLGSAEPPAEVPEGDVEQQPVELEPELKLGDGALIHPNFVSFQGHRYQLDFIKTLKKGKKPAKNEFHKPFYFGRNLLMYAVITNNQAATKLILECGQTETNPKKNCAKIDARDKQGNTAMHYAVQNRNKYIILLLMMFKAKCMKNRNDEGQAPIEIDHGIRPFIQYIKQQEGGFRILGDKYNNKEYEKVKGKILEVLTQIWKDISDDEAQPFVAVQDMNERIGRRLKDNIDYKIDLQQKWQREHPTLPPASNEHDPEAEGAPEMDYTQENMFKKEVEALTEIKDLENNFEQYQPDTSKLEQLTDVYCFIDKDLKKFTREEFLFGLVRQQMNSQIRKENEVYDIGYDYFGRFAHYFRELWNANEDNLEGGPEGEGEDDEEDN